MGLFDFFKSSAKKPSIDLTDYKFLSDDHTRIENGVSVSADNKGAWRGIRIKTSDNLYFYVTMYNMDGNHPIWGNNIQMSEKQMKLISEDSEKIILRGYGEDALGSSFADYGITLYKTNSNVDKIALHMHDRSIDIVYYNYDDVLQSNKSLDKNTSELTNIDYVKTIKSTRKGFFVYENNWVDIDCSNEYSHALQECIEYIRPEMYFNYLYRLFIKYDFENNNLDVPNENLLLKYYKEASSRIMEEIDLTILDNNVLSFDWDIHHVNYLKEINSLKDSTFHFISFNEQVQRAIGIHTNENPYLSYKSESFFQNVMFLGLRMAYSRILNEINNKSFIGAELIKSNGSTLIKIYLTPYGMQQLSSLNDNEKLSAYNNFLIENNIERIASQTLLQKYNSKVLLQYNNKLFSHLTILDEYLNDFMDARINKKHLISLFTEGQVIYQEVITE